MRLFSICFWTLFVCFSSIAVSAEQTLTETEIRNLSIEDFRTIVISRALTLEPGLDLVPDPNDAAAIIINFEGEKIGDAYVENIYNRIKTNPENFETDLDLYASSMASLKNASLAPSDNQIYLTLRHKDYISFISQSATTDEPVLVHKPYLGDMHILVMINNPNSLRALTPDDLRERSTEDIFDIGKTNLRSSLPDLGTEKILDFVTAYTLESDQLLTSGLVLLDEFWDLVEREYKGGVLFVIPSKSVIYVIDRSNPEAMNIAKKIIEITVEDGYDLLSEEIYARENGRSLAVDSN